ncbi:MFS transporter [Candidatus Coxiella mudrowiae]|uniref:MFS transporter n=1 Tax=Candidatus Coxiella mudrowiae TaxID=2054173 RepID=UPI00352D9D7B
MPIRVSIFLFLLIVSRIIRRLSYRLPMIVGLTLIALGTFLFYWTPLHATYHFFSLPLLLTGLGLGLTFLNSPALGMQALPKEKLGEKAGIIYY